MSRPRRPSVLEARVDENELPLNAKGPVECALQVNKLGDSVVGL